MSATTCSIAPSIQNTSASTMSTNANFISESATPSRSCKPPFLFRTASDNDDSGSRGLNTPNEIDPLHGTGATYHVDLTKTDPQEAGSVHHMLRDHFNYQYDTPSEFSSWSVSLLYVLVHAVRKAYACGESNVLIYVMKTEMLEDERVHYAPELLKKYKLGWCHYRKTKNTLLELTDGEYLIQGKLRNNGMWKAVNINELLEGGNLWSAFRSLNHTKYEGLLLQRLKQLRTGYFYGAGEQWALVPPPWFLKPIKLMARCFGDEWEGILMIAIISIGRRNLSDENVVALQSELASVRMPHVPFDTNKRLRTLHITYSKVPEAQLFMQILRLLQDKQDVEKEGYQAEVAVIDASKAKNHVETNRDESEKENRSMELVQCLYDGLSTEDEL